MCCCALLKQVEIYSTGMCMQVDEDELHAFVSTRDCVKRKNRQPIQTTDRLQFVCAAQGGSFRVVVVVDTNRAEKNLMFNIPLTVIGWNKELRSSYSAVCCCCPAATETANNNGIVSLLVLASLYRKTAHVWRAAEEENDDLLHTAHSKSNKLVIRKGNNCGDRQTWNFDFTCGTRGPFSRSLPSSYLLELFELALGDDQQDSSSHRSLT